MPLTPSIRFCAGLNALPLRCGEGCRNVGLLRLECRHGPRRRCDRCSLCLIQKAVLSLTSARKLAVCRACVSQSRPTRVCVGCVCVSFSRVGLVCARVCVSQSRPTRVCVGCVCVSFSRVRLVCARMCVVSVCVAQSCPTLCDPMDYTVHGILQARILEWVAFPFSRRSSQLTD